MLLPALLRTVFARTGGAMNPPRWPSAIHTTGQLMVPLRGVAPLPDPLPGGHAARGSCRGFVSDVSDAVVLTTAWAMPRPAPHAAAAAAHRRAREHIVADRVVAASRASILGTLRACHHRRSQRSASASSRSATGAASHNSGDPLPR